MLTFITGGGRSGKSSLAEEKASSYNQKIYIATAIAFDEEMKYRVEKHKETRDASWTTIEAYKNIVKELKTKAKNKDVILLDCLTNLVSNMMLTKENINWDTISDSEVSSIEEEIKYELKQFLDFTKEFLGDVIIVSNEVGMGLVPEYPLGRRFRDIAGRMNQYIASACDEAILVVSGLPIKLK